MEQSEIRVLLRDAQKITHLESSQQNIPAFTVVNFLPPKCVDQGGLKAKY